MLRKIEVLTAIGTLGCAMGIGFVMQSSTVAEKRYGPKPLIASAVAEQRPIEAKIDIPFLDVQAISYTFAAVESDIAIPLDLDSVKTAATPPSILEDPELPQALNVMDCEINAETRPIAAAMVELTMTAPCMPNERVTVHHNGMLFTEITSEIGSLALKIPALAKEAVFIIAFTSGEGAVASTIVEDLEHYGRAVLQWKGDTGFQIHAREFGADYGSQGHRWAEDPGKFSAVVAGTSGVLTRHGDVAASEPLLAEIYTFPRNSNGLSGDVVLTVEAEVTQSNCGIEVEAQSLETASDGAVRTRNLILPVPSCDSIGSFLVLNNLLQDLKVTAK